MQVDPRSRPAAQPRRGQTQGPRIADSPAEPARLPRCPNCGWQDVRPSHSGGVLAQALALFSVAPFRCRSCSHRFYRFHRKTGEL